jgi:hypothetical protein
MNCETCRYWDRPTEFRGDPITRQDAGECRSPLILHGYYDIGELPEGGALVEDDEGWGIVTHARFSCVSWTARESV